MDQGRKVKKKLEWIGHVVGMDQGRKVKKIGMHWTCS